MMERLSGFCCLPGDDHAAPPPFQVAVTAAVAAGKRRLLRIDFQMGLVLHFPSRPCWQKQTRKA